jgi:MOSC domain-containing protein
MTASKAQITGVFVYPIKSCRGIAQDSAQLAATGFTDDRHWMLVRPNGRFVTQRELPRMALIETQLTPTTLRLTAPGMAPLEVLREADGVARAVTVWKFEGRGLDYGEIPAAWASQYLETPLRLVRFDPSAPRECNPEWTPGARAVTEFSDGYPILVISRASLADLNSRLPQALPMDRFRPNIVIDGVEAYDEDRMHELRAGPVTLRIVKPCARCSITTTDQRKGAVDGVEPLRTLKEYRYDSQLRGVTFGQNVIIVEGVGEQLRVGQSFDVVWK